MGFPPSTCWRRCELLALRNSPGAREAASHDLMRRIATCGLLRYRGVRGGAHVRVRIVKTTTSDWRGDVAEEGVANSRPIPVLVSQPRKLRGPRGLLRSPCCLTTVCQAPIWQTGKTKTTVSSVGLPGLYIVNARSLAKPNALD